MSIKRRDPIDPISIEIEDNGKYADIAFLVDRADVLNDIAQLRKIWLSGQTIQNKEINNFLNIKRTANEEKRFWINFQQVVRLAKKYNLETTYISPLLAAVLSGIISDSDYNRVVREPIIYGLPEDLQLNDKPAYLSPRIRKDDMSSFPKDSKIIATIREHRKWYWLYQNPKTGYRKLTKHLDGKFPLETIRSAINAYSKKLDSYYRAV